MKIKSYVFFLATLYLLSGIPVKAMETLHMMQIQLKDKSYVWCDLAGRHVIDFKNDITLGADDKLRFVVPISLGESICQNKIYENFINFNNECNSIRLLTLQGLSNIIKTDAGLCDYEKLCQQEMLNGCTRKQIADFITNETSAIKKIFYKAHGGPSKEHTFVYTLLKNSFCNSIGRVPIEKIKMEIKQSIQDLYKKYEKDIKALNEKIAEQETRYTKMTVIYEKQKKLSYITYVLLMCIGFFGCGSFMYSQSYEKAVVDFILFSGFLWLLKYGNDSISQTEYSMAELEEKIKINKQRSAEM